LTTRNNNLRRRGDQAINSGSNGSNGVKKRHPERLFDNINAHDILTYPMLKNPSKEQLDATTPSIVAGQERWQPDAQWSTPEDQQAKIDKQQSTIDDQILTTNKGRSTFKDKPLEVEWCLETASRVAVCYDQKMMYFFRRFTEKLCVFLKRVGEKAINS
jgi:hypothetical protein